MSDLLDGILFLIGSIGIILGALAALIFQDWIIIGILIIVLGFGLQDAIYTDTPGESS